MNIGKKFNNLKAGAKKVFVGLVVLCLISTSTGIGSILVYADENDQPLANPAIVTEVPEGSGDALDGNTGGGADTNPSEEGGTPATDQSEEDDDDGDGEGGDGEGGNGDDAAPTQQTEGNGENTSGQGEGSQESQEQPTEGDGGNTSGQSEGNQEGQTQPTEGGVTPADQVGDDTNPTSGESADQNKETSGETGTGSDAKTGTDTTDDAKTGTETTDATKTGTETTDATKTGTGTTDGTETPSPTRGVPAANTECTGGEHDYSYTPNYDGTHNIRCNNCDCTGKDDCSFGDWTDNSDGETRSKTCALCGFKITERIPDEGALNHEHVYGKGTYNGDGTHTKKCTVEGCKETVTEVCSSFEYSKNDSKTHYKTCKDCGGSVTEDHTFKDGVCSLCGEKEESTTHEHKYVYKPYADEFNKHVVTCEVDGCTYKVIEDCEFGDGTVCKKCGREKGPSTKKRGLGIVAGDSTKPDALTLLKGIYPNITFATSDTYSGGNLANYNTASYCTLGSEQASFNNGNYYYRRDTAHATAIDYDYASGKTSVTANSNIAGKVTFYYEKAEKSDFSGTTVKDSVEYSFNVAINVRSLLDPVITASSPINYDYTTQTSAISSVDPATITLTSPVSGNTYALTNGTDFTVAASFGDQIPETQAGATPYHFAVTGKGNFKDSLNSIGNITVPAKALTYDGAPNPSGTPYAYAKGVVIGVENGYYISLTPEGPFSSDKVTYREGGTDQEIYVYLKKSADGAHVFKQKTQAISIDSVSIAACDFSPSGEITDYAALAGNLYNHYSITYETYKLTEGTDYTVTTDTQEAPRAGTVFYLVYEGKGAFKGTKKIPVTVKDVDVLFDGKAQESTYYNETVISAKGYLVSLDPTGEFKDSLTYSTLGEKQTVILYFKRTDGDKVITKQIDGLTISKIPMSKVAFTPDKDIDDYASVNSTDITAYYKLTYDGKELVKGTDYTVSTDIPAELISGTKKSITFTGAGKFDGIIKKNVTIKDVGLKFDGAAQSTQPYNEQVEITAEGYTIATKKDGEYAASYVHTKAGTNISFDLYLKNTTSGKIVKTTVTGLNIKDYEIKVLYNGSPTMEAYYNNSVKLSAKGYKVCQTRDGEFLSTLLYETLGLKQNFYIFFQDEEDPKIIVKKYVQNLNIYPFVDIPIKYNGGDYKDWFNTDVTLTCQDYLISEPGKQDYQQSYTISGTGTVTVDLDFRDKNKKVTTYKLTVNIDRTAPTGAVAIDEYSSDKFLSTNVTIAYAKTGRPITIASADGLSGVDKVEYYVGEKFFSSTSDVEVAITDAKSSWKTYDSANKPATGTKDGNNYTYVKITDKAGNSAYVSAGNIICDTVAPKVTAAKVTKADQGDDLIVTMTGKDTASGVNRFKVMNKDKADKPSPPSKEDIFNNGTYVEVKAESGQEAGATYTATGLDPEKTYIFYVAAVDRAGNVSDVKTVEGPAGKKSSDKKDSGSDSKSDSKSGSGSGGLTPAPSGIAGGGSFPASGNKSSGGSKKSSSDSTKKNNVATINNTNISRAPYISDATGSTKIGEKQTSGWNKIVNEVKTADKGSVIKVEMSGMSTVPNELINSMNNQDVQVKLQMADDVEWSIHGNDISADTLADMDMGVKLGSKNIPAQILSEVTGSYPHVEFSINHDGDFGFTATIAIPVGATNAGMNATLYYYDAPNKELVIQGASIVDGEGYARFPMVHASDYTIVISPEKIIEAAPADAVTATVIRQDNDTSFEGAQLRLTDMFQLRGSVRVWLFIVAIISAALCAMILILPGFQSDNEFGPLVK